MALNTGSNVAGPCRQTECLGVLHPVALDIDDASTQTQKFARNGLSYCVPWAPVLLVVAGIWIFSPRDGIATPVHEGPEAVKRAPVATTTSTHRRTPQNPMIKWRFSVMRLIAKKPRTPSRLVNSMPSQYNATGRTGSAEFWSSDWQESLVCR